MFRRLLPAMAVVVLSAGMAQAGVFSLSLNDYSAQMALGHTITEDTRGKSILNVRGLYNNRKDSKLVSAALEALGPIGGKSGLELGAGVRGYYVASGDEHIAGAGLGGLIRFVPPQAPKVKFSGSVYYCPKILTGLDGERLLDTEFAAAYNFAPRVTAFLSYTVIKADLDNFGARTVDDSFRGGVSLSF